MELGGAEVYLQPAGNRSRERPTRPSRQRRAPRPVAEEPKWKKGAPPIPGPGLTVESPWPACSATISPACTTLEAVAERIRTTYCCGLCPQRTNAVPGEGNPRAG